MILDCNGGSPKGDHATPPVDKAERWFVCVSCRVTVALPADTPCPARCQCSPGSFMLLPLRGSLPAKLAELRQQLAATIAASEANKVGFEEYERRYYLELDKREAAEAERDRAVKLLRHHLTFMTCENDTDDLWFHENGARVSLKAQTVAAIAAGGEGTSHG